jgi:N6-adenosine-specific RNA methylase IME4
MSVADISALPVGDLGRPARVFLWTTNRYLRSAFDVLDAWGFVYAQTLVWHKTNASPFTGSVAHGSAEFMLVGTNGPVPVLAKMPSSVLAFGHQHQHSRKPEMFLDWIEQVSPGPYLEMFSRRARLGWDTWGDEALGGTELLKTVA